MQDKTRFKITYDFSYQPQGILYGPTFRSVVFDHLTAAEEALAEVYRVAKERGARGITGSIVTVEEYTVARLERGRIRPEGNNA